MMTTKTKTQAPGNGGDVCAECGRTGMRADTTAGEILYAGEVIAIVPDGVPILMFGDVRGGRTSELLCEDCAGVSQ